MRKIKGKPYLPCLYHKENDKNYGSERAYRATPADFCQSLVDLPNCFASSRKSLSLARRNYMIGLDLNGGSVMTVKPPDTITVEIADYLAKIVELVTRLEYGTEFKRNIKLHQENRLRTIHSSLAIEGNSLSLGEVKNAYEAYDRILTFDPYSSADFLEAHRLMTDGLVEEAGRSRSRDVGVFDGGRAIHIGARPKFVPELVEKLFEWARTSELQNFI